MEYKIYKEIIESSDPRLKRHINHDERSKNFKFDTSGIIIKDVMHNRLVSIFDQGQIGSCTGNAAIGCVNTSPFIQLTNPHYSPDEIGAVKLYSDAEKIDGGVGYPPQDVGSSGLSVAKALKNTGMISGYAHTFTLNDMLKALTTQPVITGTSWYEGMFIPDSDGRVHPTGKLVGGHEYEAIGIDTKNKRIWFCNSWGTTWGVGGKFYMTYDDYNTLLTTHGDVTVLTPLINKPSKKYIYFKPSEIVNLKDELVSKLDEARGIAGIPFVITSGFRTPEQNKAVGGVPDSAHLTGEAVDIACSDSVSRMKIVTALLQVCFNRIEICPSHVHCDISQTLPQNVIVLSQNG